MEPANNECSVGEDFDTSVFPIIHEARKERQREELVVDYGLFTERIKCLEGDYEDHGVPAKEAQDKMKKCADMSEELLKNNAEETALLKDLEDLIEDLLFRFETLHHVRSQVSSEESLTEEKIEEYEEGFAQQEIRTIFEDCSNYKNNVSNNIRTCGATMSKLKVEISEIMNNNPRVRRQSRAYGLLGKLNMDKNMINLQNQMRKSVFLPHESPQEAEEFNPEEESTPIFEFLTKFVKDQELPDDETHVVTNKVNTLYKMIHYYKSELKTATSKATEDHIKINNLQSRLPKIEESRVRLSQKCEGIQDQLNEKKVEISKMKLKIQAMELVASKNLDAPKELAKDKMKQAPVPKSVLKDILQASDKEVEGKLAELGSSNEAIKVVLVRKNKQIRQLNGTMIQMNLEIKSLKQKLEFLEESIVAGTADADAIKTEQDEKEVETTVSNPSPTLDVHIPSVSPIAVLDSQFTNEDSILETTDSSRSEYVNKEFVDSCVGTQHIKVSEVGIQTLDTEVASPVPDQKQLDQISFKLNRKRKKSRRGSAMVGVVGVGGGKRNSKMGDERRKSSMDKQGMFGIGSPAHHMTPTDLNTIEEFTRDTKLNHKTVKSTDDIAVLQKYIASMREQTEKSMEKVREFIAKEKSRNDATTRRLINEHEKVLLTHKKEMNKIVYSVFRFKDMVTEILDGKDITQVILRCTFKFEQSPLQLRIQSTEMLSSMEYEIFQALKEKDMKIRDLSGRKRLDDKELDRRIKEREKTVFSILDYTNEKLRKEKERVSMREQWVNKKIKTELQFEKQQEMEVQTLEIALQRFWRQHGTAMNVSADRTPSPPDSGQETEPQETEKIKYIEPKEEDHHHPSDTGLGMEALIPRLYISVPNQRNNIEYLNVAHRAGALTNLGNKLITNIIARWLEMTEQKLTLLFTAYIKYARWSNIMKDLMHKGEEGDSFIMDMDRAMLLHKRIRDNLDLRYKKLHVELSKLNSYRGNMLEEEISFFDGVKDQKALKSIVRPNMLNINHNAMFKRIMQHVKPPPREIHVTFPHMTSEETESLSGSYSKIEELSVVKQIENVSKHVTKWRTDIKCGQGPNPKSLLVPRLLQIDTDKLVPVRLVQTPTQRTTKQYAPVSGLPPIPLFGGKMKTERIFYVPNIASMWNRDDRS